MARRAHESEVDRDMRGKVHSRGLWAAVAVLAARQFGVVSRIQLLAIGVSADTVDRWIAARRLHPIHRGVYAVGHTRISREGRWLAAVLACGDGAVLSHRSAAALWGILQYEGRPEITTRHAHRRGDLLVARRSFLEPDEVTSHHGIPVTTPMRTLLDLGACIQPHQLDRAVRESDYLRLFELDQLRALLERHPGRRGTRHLRIAVERAAAAHGHTRSELEDRFRALVLNAHLPTPLFNARLELNEITIEPDVLWPEHRVIVELDGWAAHGTRDRFVADRARDREAHAAGYTVLRYTWADLDRSAIRKLKRLLSARTPRPRGRPRSAARSG